MSFVKNNNQQISLLDSTFNLTEREKRMLEKSWAKTFADKVFPAIDENIFSVHRELSNQKMHTVLCGQCVFLLKLFYPNSYRLKILIQYIF